MLTLTYWAIVVFIVLVIVELLRRKALREKYAVVWLLLALSLVGGAIFPKTINEISQFLGFQFLSNFVLFILGIINIFVAIQLSLSISKSENEIQILAEEIALLKLELREKS